MRKHEPQKQLLIFLSHASEDKRQVRNLNKRLRKDGFDPWLDEERLLPGQDWDLEIEKAMRVSDAILLCFSKLSVAKDGYVQREHKRAMRYLEEKPEGTIYVIPVRLDDCELPYFIREIQWLDYPADYDNLIKALQVSAGGKALPRIIAQPETRKPIVSKVKGGNVFRIQGDVHVGGNMIGGDQISYYYQNQHTINVTSPSQFMEELRKIKVAIEQLKFQPEVDKVTALRMELAQTELDSAMDEAAKEEPVSERINKTLSNAKEMIEKISGNVASATKLGTMLGQLAVIAMKIFGN